MNSRELVRAIEEMIEYDCKVITGDAFQYNWENHVIMINVSETYLDNIEWKKFLKKEFNFNLNHENWFTLSVLHELGHHYTLDYFDEEEVAKSQHACAKQNEHFYEWVERIATEWAVAYYNSTDMDEWNKKITALLN